MVNNKCIGDGFCIGHYVHEDVCNKCTLGRVCMYATSACLDPMMSTSSVGKARRNIIHHMVQSCGAFQDIAKSLVLLLVDNGNATPGGTESALTFHLDGALVASLTCTESRAAIVLEKDGEKKVIAVEAGTIQKALSQLEVLLS